MMLCLAPEVYSSGTMVGDFLKDQSVVDVGCSYYSKPKTGKDTVFVDMDETNLWINLLGKDTRFKLVASKGKKFMETGEDFKVGDVFTRIFQSKNGRIEIKNRVTEVCPPDTNGGCESTKVLGEFKITWKGNQETLQLKGSCGA